MVNFPGHVAFAGFILATLPRSVLSSPAHVISGTSKLVLQPPPPPSSGYPFKDLHLPYYPPNAECHDYMIPLAVEYDKIAFNGSRFADEVDLQDFLSIATTRPTAGFPGVLADSTKVQETYQVAASFCSPKDPSRRSKTVILATHGIGPARTHWNSGFKPEEFNFVQHAVEQGYSVFFYDRVGCGASQKLSGYEAQINLAIGVVQSLAKLIRSGQYTGTLGQPSKIAGMGFSFGSYTTHGVISLTPDLLDAVILTAIGFNEDGLNVNGLVRSFQNRIAALQNPALYGDRDTGYLTWVDKEAQVLNYFKKPNYELSTLEYVEAAKEPFALTEFLTLLAGPQDASGFSGPALHITGESDYIFCDGLCAGIFEEPARTVYKNAKLQLALHPGASHHLNFQTNATGAYTVIMDFLKSNGL